MEDERDAGNRTRRFGTKPATGFTPVDGARRALAADFRLLLTDPGKLDSNSIGNARTRGDIGAARRPSQDEDQE